MKSAESTELYREVRRFHEWAESYPRARTYGEWECDYEHWDEMYDAYVAHLDNYRPEQWEGEDVELLLYALARDNECEHLKEKLIEKPAHLLALARAAYRSLERDALWQLADALTELARENSEAHDLIEQFALDKDEYVNRRALLALGQLKSPRVERFAVRAWETGEEYQRIAALRVLADTSSPLLSEYLALAEQDGRKGVIANAGISHYIRANEYFDLDEFDRAIADYDQAIRLGSDNTFLNILMNRWGIASVYRDRGDAYGAKGDLDRAISDYSEAIRLNPKYAKAFHNRGTVYNLKGDHYRAIADYDEAIRLDPTDAFFFNSRGAVHKIRSDFDCAILDFSEAIRLGYKDSRVLLNRGEAYQAKGDLDLASADFLAAKRLAQ